MPRRKLNYNEGDIFVVPLRSQGYGLGIVARMDRKGIILGYFFSVHLASVPKVTDLPFLSSEKAILIEFTGDLGLLQNSWTVISHHPSWDRNEWPVPEFGRISADKNQAYRVEYDNNSLRVIRETPISIDEAKRLPKDGLSGYGALEIILTMLIDGKASRG